MVSNVFQPFSLALAFKIELPVIQKSESKASNMSAMVFGASARAKPGSAVAAAAASEVFENWRRFMIIEFSSRTGCSTGSVEGDVSGDPVVGQAGGPTPYSQS